MNRPVLQLLAWSLCVLLAAPAGAQKSVGESIDDASIAATIKAGLLDNRDTSGTRINVESARGVVQLSGFASSEAEKATAARLAQDTGVKQVINNLVVAAEPRSAPGSTTA